MAALGEGPARDDVVDFFHNADGFGDGDDDFLVVVNVVRREFPFFAVLEPFFADLIAANVEFPNFLGDTFKKLPAVDVDAARFDSDFRVGLGVAHPFDEVVAGLFVAGDERGEGPRTPAA